MNSEENQRRVMDVYQEMAKNYLEQKRFDGVEHFIDKRKEELVELKKRSF